MLSVRTLLLPILLSAAPLLVQAITVELTALEDNAPTREMGPENRASEEIDLIDSDLPYSGSAKVIENDVKNDLLSYYWYVVANNSFSLSYANNLVLDDIDLQGDTKRAGSILLRLVLFLEKSEDPYHKMLLKKINKYFFLRMHRQLVDHDLRKDQAARTVEGLYELYAHKVDTSAGKIAPFRTTLTKVFIVLSTINETQLMFSGRKETLLIHLNKIKREMLRINDGLGDQKIDEDCIKDFIKFIGVYEVRQPIIPETQVRNIILGTLAIATIAAIIYWQHKNIKAKVIDPTAVAIDHATKWIGRRFKGGLREIGEGLAQGLGISQEVIDAGGAPVLDPVTGEPRLKRPNEVLPAGQSTRVQVLIGQVAESFSDTLTKNPIPIEDEPLPAGMTTRGVKLGDKLGEGLGKSLTENRFPDVDANGVEVDAKGRPIWQVDADGQPVMMDGLKVPVLDEHNRPLVGAMTTHGAKLGKNLAKALGDGLAEDLVPVADRERRPAGMTTRGLKIGDELLSGINKAAGRDLLDEWPRTTAAFNHAQERVNHAIDVAGRGVGRVGGAVDRGMAAGFNALFGWIPRLIYGAANNQQPAAPAAADPQAQNGGGGAPGAAAQPQV